MSHCGNLAFTPLVDRYALAESGITPATPVRPERGNPLGMRGFPVGALQSGAVAIGRGRLPDLANPRRRDKPGCALGAWSAVVGTARPTGHLLKDAALLSGAASLLPIEAWKEQFSEPPLPWKGVRPGGDEAFDTYGWHAYRLPLPTRRHGFALYRPRPCCCGWSIFLLIAGLGWWKAAERPALVVFLLVVAAIVAIFVPLAYVPIASCTVLGLLFCLVVRLVFPRRPAIVREPPRDRTFELPAKLRGRPASRWRR